MSKIAFKPTGVINILNSRFSDLNHRQREIECKEKYYRRRDAERCYTYILQCVVVTPWKDSSRYLRIYTLHSNKSQN